MFRLPWGNPKISLGEFHSYLETLLGGKFSGLIEEDSYLYIDTSDPLIGTEENAILDYVYTLNTQPAQVVVSSTPPFGAKTVTVAGVTKKLYARNIGFQNTLAAGVNTVTYTIALPWVKILGVEVINCEALDYVDLKILDSASGGYSGVPNLALNQFAFANNLPKDYYMRMANFDADIYLGMQIQITYTSVSAKTVGFNLLMNEVK